MKKQFIIPIIGFLFVSCNSDDPTPVEDSGAPITTIENIRTETEAVEIATRSLNEFYPTEARSSRDLSNMNVVLLGRNASRSTDVTNPLYVVNFGDDNGYAIVAANKDVDPLLAITESGTISSLDNIDNPGLKIFVNGAMKLQKDTTAIVPGPILPGGEEVIDEYRNDTIFHAQNTVAPRIEVKWGQRNPEGILCPNGICGCVSTAAAQSLSYFEYPNSLKLTYKGWNGEEISLDWNTLKYVFWSTEHSTQLSSLCREIGYKIGAKYDAEKQKTSASLYDLMNYLKLMLPKNRFVVSKFAESQPETNIALGNGIILMAAKGVRSEENEEIAHAWVIDGYIYKDYTVKVYKSKINSPIEVLEREFDKTELYSHINWGWYGQDNGYFKNYRISDSKIEFNQKFQYFSIQTK